jgi:hypothetical protein
MAVLEQPHWLTVDAKLRAALTLIGRQPFARRFYLAGGTALALQVGHRYSVDLDFFADEDELMDRTRHEIVEVLEQSATVDVREDVIGNLLLSVNGLSVGFFSYGYRLLEAVAAPDLPKLASMADIGLMKLDALIARGARKDFIDLHFIWQTVPLEQLLELRPLKYPRAHNFEVMLLESLTNFDHANLDTMPQMLVPFDWDQAKADFAATARQLATRWLSS